MSPTTDPLDESSRPVARAVGVWRRYRRQETQRSSLKATLALGRAGMRSQWFWALREVDLAVHRGEAVGVVGPNGAGKSTLLRLIGGVGRPDRGRVERSGTVGALLDLGREFHPDLTGRQNAELSAVVAGWTQATFRRKLADIVDFAELHDFIDDPLRAYSDGMRARLAFSVVAQTDPDLLLVDEVLAVGDAEFQRRSIDRIEQLRAAGAAVVFVSHDLHLARRVCSRAVWLDRGVVRGTGDAREVIADYLAEVAPTPSVGTTGVLREVQVLDGWDAPTSSIVVGGGAAVEFSVYPPDDEPVRASVVISRAGDDPSVKSDTIVEAASRTRLAFERLDIAPGAYEIVVAVVSADWRAVLGQVSLSLHVSGDGSDAPVAPPLHWRKRRLDRGDR